MKSFLLILLIASLAVAGTLRVRYGGGGDYQDLSTNPLLPDAELETVLAYPEPIGNVAVGHDGRLFFTVHPESRPQGNKLLEWVDGAAIPFPDGKSQPELFDTVLGLTIDQHDRLWTIDHGNHGFSQVRLLAFALESGETIHDRIFPTEIAPAGSMFADLQVTADGRFVLISDASLWRKQPALVVYDLELGRARRVLEEHESIQAQDFLIRNKQKDMSYLGGLVTLKTGIDGIAIGSRNDWLYFAASNHQYVFRAPLARLLDETLPPQALHRSIEKVSNKTLSNGLGVDVAGNLYVTDVEHGSVFVVGNNRHPVTLIRSAAIRWADDLAFGPDGSVYLADSALPDQILKSRRHIQSQGPYFIYRFPPVGL